MRFKSAIAVGLTLLVASIGRPTLADISLYESFNYPAGTLAGQGGWTTTGTGGNVISSGLTYSPLNTVGGAVDMTGGATTINFLQLGQVFDETSVETWVSMLAQRTGDTALTNFAGLSFYNTGGTAAANAEWAISTTTQTSVNPQQWRLNELGVQFGDSGVPIVNGQTDLLLAQIIWNGAGDQTMNLWVNPNITGGGFGTALATINTTITNFDKIRLASQNGAPFIFDEIRIGQTAADVLPGAIPEPSGLLVFGLAGLVLGTRRRRIA